MGLRRDLTEIEAAHQAEERILFLSVSLCGSNAEGSRVVNLRVLALLVLLLSLAFDIWKMILIYLFSGSSLVANFQEHEEMLDKWQSESELLLLFASKIKLILRVLVRAKLT